MPRTRDDAAFAARQQEILRAAGELFVAHGFHGTGIAAICQAVGMSPGTLYRYFPSKEALIEALVEEERDGLLALFAELEGSADPIRDLTEVVMAAIRAVSEPGWAALALEVAAEGARNVDIQALLDRTRSEIVGHLADLLQAAQAAGRVRKDVDAPLAASLLVAVVDGLTAPGAAPSHDPLVEHTIRALLTRWLGEP